MSIFNKIFRGTVANDKTGDPLREGGQIVNDNFDKAIAQFDSIKDLEGLVPDYDGQQISVIGYHPNSDIGGGKLFYDANRAKSDHDGMIVFDPVKIFPTNWNDLVQVDEWFTADGTGNGVFVRSNVEYVTPMMSGALEDGDYSKSLGVCFNSGYKAKVHGRTLLAKDINITGKTEIELDEFSTIKSIPEELPDTVVPSDIWSLTNKIFILGSGASLKITGGTIDCSGERPDGLPASSGPTSGTPDFGEYAITANGADSLILKTKIINYLSDGAVGAPNGDVCIKAVDTPVVDISGSEFYEIGNEVAYITAPTTNCTFNMDKVTAIGSRGSFNAYDLTKVSAFDGNYENFSGSPLNLFSNNINCTRNKIKNVTNSHGIDFSEGLYRFSNIICTKNIIDTVNNNGIFGNGIDSIIADNIIINAGNYGINADNTIGGVAKGNLQIHDNEILNCTSGGIFLKGVGGVSYDVSVKDNSLSQDSLIAGSIGILLNNHSDVDIQDNFISGYELNHFKALSRINNINFSGNKLKQPHGSHNQSSDIVLFDAQSDAFSLNEIIVSDNDFQALPPINSFSVNFTGYSLEYGRFPNGTNMQVADNKGVCLVRADDNGVMYSALKGNSRAGSTLEGRFNGGDTVNTRPTASGQFSGYKILAQDPFINGVYTFRTAPTATISTTNGSNSATMSSSSHSIQAGDSIRILDIDGSGGVFDTIVIFRDSASGNIILRDAASSTASGKSVQFLGTALNQGLPVSTL